MKYFFLLLFIPSLCYAQQIKGIENRQDSLSDNIFRVVISKNNSNSLSFQYERKIKSPYTLKVELGPTLDIGKFGNIDDPTKSKYQFTFSIFGSVEARYYFNLNHRISKGRNIKNFSAFYVSLEEYFLSNPVLLINKKDSQAVQGNLQTFINIGWQKQIERFYFHMFFGPSIARRSFNKYFTDQLLPKIQLGLSLGYVF